MALPLHKYWQQNNSYGLGWSFCQLEEPLSPSSPSKISIYLIPSTTAWRERFSDAHTYIFGLSGVFPIACGSFSNNINGQRSLPLGTARLSNAEKGRTRKSERALNWNSSGSASVCPREETSKRKIGSSLPIQPQFSHPCIWHDNSLLFLKFNHFMGFLWELYKVR